MEQKELTLAWVIEPLLHACAMAKVKHNRDNDRLLVEYQLMRVQRDREEMLKPIIKRGKF